MNFNGITVSEVTKSVLLKGYMSMKMSYLTFFQNIVKKIENIDVDGSVPTVDCVISDSGVLPLEKSFYIEKNPVQSI